MKPSSLQDYAIKLQSVIDAAIDGIITIDSHGNIETINTAALSLFQYESEDLIGQNIKILMPQPHRSGHDGYIKNYLTTKKPQIIGTGREVLGQMKNGETFPFRLAVGEVILNDRILFTGIIHDLSDVKKAEKDLKDLNRQLENRIAKRTSELEDAINKLLLTNTKLKSQETELTHALNKEKDLNELKSRFVSMASHEFRTPLSTILSSAVIISKYSQTDQQENRMKHVDRIKSSVNHLTGILNDFLSLAKIEEGAEEVNVEEIDLNIICKEIIEDVQAIKKPEQIILTDIKAEKILSDKRIVRNILFNLLSNAIKYTPHKGEINIRAYTKQSICVIEIVDTGIGIPKVDQQHLFSRFFRASNVETIQGTGLGLNIVKRYVSLLAGEISFISSEGQGTTFTIKLPQSI